jgi:hypothetical protein
MMRTRRAYLAAMALVLRLPAAARGEMPDMFTRIAHNSGLLIFRHARQGS